MPTQSKVMSDPQGSVGSEHNKKRVADREVIFQRNQQVSPLLLLPPELRNRIYKHVFCRSLITKFRTLSCWEYPRSQLSLLQVCRQIYHEARLLPFVTNVFAVFLEHAIHMLFNTFTREQRNTISHMHLYSNALTIYSYSQRTKIQGWVVVELRSLTRLPRLKHMDLSWSGVPDVDKELLRNQFSDVLIKMERADIKITVVEDFDVHSLRMRENGIISDSENEEELG